MHNFMSYERRWLDDPHLGDHVGRTMWALGAVVAARPPRAVATPSLRMMTDIADAVQQSDSLRTIAFAVIGLTRPPIQALTPQLLQTLRQLAIGFWTPITALRRRTGRGSKTG